MRPGAWYPLGGQREAVPGGGFGHPGHCEFHGPVLDDRCLSCSSRSGRRVIHSISGVQNWIQQTNSPSRIEQTIEEITVPLKGHAHFVGRSVSVVVELLAILSETLDEIGDHVGDKLLGLLDSAVRIINETNLYRTPPGTERVTVTYQGVRDRGGFAAVGWHRMVVTSIGRLPGQLV